MPLRGRILNMIQLLRHAKSLCFSCNIWKRLISYPFSKEHAQESRRPPPPPPPGQVSSFLPSFLTGKGPFENDPSGVIHCWGLGCYDDACNTAIFAVLHLPGHESRGQTASISPFHLSVHSSPLYRRSLQHSSVQKGRYSGPALSPWCVKVHLVSSRFLEQSCPPLTMFLYRGRKTWMEFSGGKFLPKFTRC